MINHVLEWSYLLLVLVTIFLSFVIGNKNLRVSFVWWLLNWVKSVDQLLQTWNLALNGIYWHVVDLRLVLNLDEGLSSNLLLEVHLITKLRTVKNYLLTTERRIHDLSRLNVNRHFVLELRHVMNLGLEIHIIERRRRSVHVVLSREQDIGSWYTHLVIRWALYADWSLELVKIWTLHKPLRNLGKCLREHELRLSELVMLLLLKIRNNCLISRLLYLQFFWLGLWWYQLVLSKAHFSVSWILFYCGWVVRLKSVFLGCQLILGRNLLFILWFLQNFNFDTIIIFIF